LIYNKQQTDKKEIIMTNDELQVTEIQETDAVAAVQVVDEEVEVVSAMAADIVEDAADPNEAVSIEVEAVAEAEGEEDQN
jgi:hypothetical protein